MITGDKAQIEALINDVISNIPRKIIMINDEIYKDEEGESFFVSIKEFEKYMYSNLVIKKI